MTNDVRGHLKPHHLLENHTPEELVLLLLRGVSQLPQGHGAQLGVRRPVRGTREAARERVRATGACEETTIYGEGQASDLALLFYVF